MKRIFNQIDGLVYRPAFKCSLIGAAAIAGAASIAGSAIGAGASASLNKDTRNWQHDENVYARDWSSEQSRIARKWEEEMYNKYNSPSAMMHQYQEAGLNPYLNNQLGSEMSATPAIQSAPSVSAPPTHDVGSHITTGINNAVSGMLQAQAVDAQSANQQSQALQNTVRSAIEAYKISPELAKQILQTGFANYGGASDDFSRVSREFEAAIANQEADSALKRAQEVMERVYSPKVAQAKINEVEQGIVESASRIGKMASDAKVNDAKINELASETFKNYRDGLLAMARCMTENQFRETLFTTAKANMFRAQYEASDAGIQHERNAASYRGDKKYLDWYGNQSESNQIINAVGNYIGKILDKIPASVFLPVKR